MLDVAARRFGLNLRFDHFDFASCDYYAAHGRMMPEDWKATIGGYEQDRLTLQRITELTSSAVARRFRLPAKGKLAPGYDADITLVDLSSARRLQADDLLYRHRVSPYLKHPLNLTGRVLRTLVRGRTVFLNGQVTCDPRGKLIWPHPTERAR